MWNTQPCSDYWPNSLTDEEFRALVNRIGLIERWPEPLKWKEEKEQPIETTKQPEAATNKV